MPDLNNTVLCRIADKRSFVEYLDLSNCFQLDGESIQIIAENWIHTLKSIDLEYCHFLTDTDLSVLLSPSNGFIIPRQLADFDPIALEEERTPLPLERINMAHTNISDAGVKVLVSRCPNLKYVNLSGCPRVTDYSLSLIAQHCKGLEELKVAECKISDFGLQLVAQECKSHLVTIDVNDCRISNSIVSYLAYYCPNLSILKLRNTSITGPALCHLVDRLNLKELNIQGLPIGDTVLLECIARQKELRILDLSFCYALSFEAVHSVARDLCPSLEEIHIFGRNFSDAAISILRRSAGSTSIFI